MNCATYSSVPNEERLSPATFDHAQIVSTCMFFVPTTKHQSGSAAFRLSHLWQTRKSMDRVTDDGHLVIEWMRTPSAPVLELLSCKCLRSYKLPSCTCLVNGLACTNMCLVNGLSCTNMCLVNGLACTNMCLVNGLACTNMCLVNGLSCTNMCLVNGLACANMCKLQTCSNQKKEQFTVELGDSDDGDDDDD